MKFTRLFTTPYKPVQDQISWATRRSEIKDAGGKIIFEMDNVEVPAHWSQTATNILAQKYFRKAGICTRTKKVEEGGIPEWLQRSESFDDSTFDGFYETSAKRVFHRLAGCWTYWGWKEGIFKLNNAISNLVEENAQIFYDELYYMLAMQYAAPNSPQWFNTGLYWAYGIAGSESGQWAFDYDKLNNGTWNDRTVDKDGNLSNIIEACLYQTKNSYERPQVHACYIQPVKDDLVNPGGIMDLWTREVRLFKHGSGTGTNFSSIRGKGEKLSGGGVSSGLMSFLKIGDVAAGAVQSGGTTRRAAKMVCLDLDHPEIEDFIDWKMKEERKARALVTGSQVLNDGGETYTSTFEGEAISTVSGQNSNNSVRVTDEFLCRVDGGSSGKWFLISRTDPDNRNNVIQAADLWQKICHAAWTCADPGLQFHDTINAWHTCKADGEINASNPCSEYMFLDNTACNLASLNLLKFGQDETFALNEFVHAVRLWTTVLEISVCMASYPSKEIALGSYNYRTLGLGYANLGRYLFEHNFPYDSVAGRHEAAHITSMMNEVAYKTSAEIAKELGPFPRWEVNKESMTEVIEKHGLKPSEHGYRNAQVTLLAPTGTIALLMDCDTTGIEPFFAQKTIKNLAGGGVMNFENKVPVSECAIGDGCLSPLAHIKMVAAVQPFLSGAVSKTVNMPNESTIEDVSFIYREAHRLGLKAVAIYRDGSKMTQPLNVERGMSSNKLEHALKESNSIRYFATRGTREPLPSRRKGYTQKLRVDGRSLYLRTGEYADGSLGEIFVNLSREGSTVRSLMESFAKAISIGAQYGVPLEVFVEAFIHTKFEPSGVVQGHDRVKMCSSIIDLIFRELAVNYLKRDDLAHVEPEAKTKAQETIASLIANQQSIGTFGDVLYQNLEQLHITSEYKPNGHRELCLNCGNATLIRTGTCSVCTNCHASSGCG